MDKYGPNMPTKTIRVFTRHQISGGEYLETNMDKYGPTMATKTIGVFSGPRTCGSDYSETNNGIATDTRLMPKPNIITVNILK